MRQPLNRPLHNGLEKLSGGELPTIALAPSRIPDLGFDHRTSGLDVRALSA